MPTPSTATVRMFGALHSIRKSRGLQSTVEVHIPPDGCTALSLARELDLPLDKVEAVFINHLVYNLEHMIMGGDRVAFIPRGIPGPYRLLLGIYDAGQQRPAPAG